MRRLLDHATNLTENGIHMLGGTVNVLVCLTFSVMSSVCVLYCISLPYSSYGLFCFYTAFCVHGCLFYIHYKCNNYLNDLDELRSLKV